MDVLVVAHNQAKELKLFLKQKSLYDNKWLAKNLPDSKIALPINKGSGDFKDLADQFPPNVHFEMHKIHLEINAKKELNNPANKLRNNLQSLQLWSEELINDFPKSYEKFDDLLLLNNDSFKMDFWQYKGLWESVAFAFNCKRIARKSAISTNLFRSPRVTMILGNSGYVRHIDNGIKYSYDITKCMFSPGNITEKLRVSKFDCSSETVVDLYAGIGYFTLPYLVRAKAKKLIACEWNPHALEALRNNLELNKVAERCEVLEGDNRLTCPHNVADRINLGLIPSSEEGWVTACRALRKDIGGFMHVHGNVTSKQSKYLPSNSENSNEEKLSQRLISLQENRPPVKVSTKPGRPNFDKTVQRLEWDEWAASVSLKLKEILEEIDDQEWSASVVHVEHVKSYAPRVDHIVADIHCRPNCISRR